MERKVLCNRCGKEITIKYSKDGEDLSFDASTRDDLYHMANEVFKGVFNFEIGDIKTVLRPKYLCVSCADGYNKIIDKTNNEIKEYFEKANPQGK